MPRLPHTIDFNGDDYPELAHIFRGIDIGIAAIVASDPALRPKTGSKRRSSSNRQNAAMLRGGQAQRHAA
jgi:hypothetical protein